MGTGELPTREDSEIHKPFINEELAELWNHTDDLGARVALILCYTGMRPTEFALIKISDVDLTARFIRGGIKTAAGKNRLIPIAEKIFPLIEGFFNLRNEFFIDSRRKTDFERAKSPQ